MTYFLSFDDSGLGSATAPSRSIAAATELEAAATAADFSGSFFPLIFFMSPLSPFDFFFGDASVASAFAPDSSPSSNASSI